MHYVRGNKVNVKLRQIGTRSLPLVKRWQWSRAKVERYLKELEYSNKIAPQKNNVITLLSICNYNDYQGIEPQSEPQTDHRRATDEPQTDPNKKDNKEKNNKNDNNSSKETAKRFTPPSIEEVQFYISEKGYSVDAERFVSFYECKGWYVGKNKMKNWKAAITTWSKSEKSKMSNIKTSSSTQNVNDIWNQK